LSECDIVARTYLPKRKHTQFSLNDTCVVDYEDEDLREEVESEVDCEAKCEFTTETEENEEAYESCVEDCKDTVRLSTKGSIQVDKKTLEVKDATIPVSCMTFMEESEWGELEWSEKAMNKIVREFRRAGCAPPEEGWMHPHEFVPGFGEVEEEPAICYLHVKSEKPGQCKLPDVLKISRVVV